MMTSHHPEYRSDEEAISAFVDGTVSTSERERMTSHLVECTDCNDLFMGVVDLKLTLGDEDAEVVQPSFERKSRRPWWLAIAAAVLLAIGIPRGWQWYGERTLLPALKNAAAARDERSIEPRLAGFEHRRHRVLRGGDPGGAELDVQIAAANAAERAEKNPSAHNLHAHGVGLLLLKRVPEAIAALEEAVRKETGAQTTSDAIMRSRDAQLLNDLSAAYLARAHTDADRLYLAALSAAERARELDPKSTEAAFNRALAIEGLPSRDDAVQAWKDYQQLETDPAWKEEAQRHLERLAPPDATNEWDRVKPLVEQAAAAGDVDAVERHARAFPQQVRLLAQHELFSRWSRQSMAAQSGDAATTLRSLTTVGEALRRVNGDEMIAGSVRTIEKGTEASRRRIAEAHAWYDEGQRLQSDQNHAAAAAAFLSARVAFEETGSPFRHIAAHQIALCHYNLNDYAACAAALSSPGCADVEPTYAAVATQISSLRGLIASSNGAPAEALAWYRAALQYASRGGEAQQLAGINRNLAEAFEMLGDEESVWLHRLRALRLGMQSGVPREMLLTIAACTRYAATEYPHAARVLLARQLALAETMPDGRYAVTAYQWMGVVAARLGQRRTAQEHLARAREHLPKIKSEETRNRSEATLAFVEATYLESDAPDRARLIETASEFANKTGNHFRMARLQLERGRLAAAQRQLDRAEDHFRAGLTELELQTKSVRDDSTRDSLMELHGDLYDDLIRLYVDRNRMDDAFRLGDARRASLQRFDVPNAPRPSIPPGLLLAEYVVLPDRTLIRASTGADVVTSTIDIGREPLHRLVSSCLTEIGGDVDPSATLERLHEALLSPIAKPLARAKRIVVVADAPLSSVPFAALRARGEKHYLIEQHAVAVAPSVSVLSVQPARPVTRDVFILANPDLPRDEQSGWDSLKGAEYEADRIAALYEPSRAVFTRAQATRRHLLEQAGQHSVVHIATHALVDETAPLRSALLLSGAGGAVDALPAAIIGTSAFPRTSVVIVAGCQTARAPSVRRNAQTLAAAFVRARVPSVVGSVIDLDDHRSSELLIRMHQRLLAGLSPQDALRAAQLQELAKERQPTALKQWAVFQLTTSAV